MKSKHKNYVENVELKLVPDPLLFFIKASCCRLNGNSFLGMEFHVRLLSQGHKYISMG